MSAVLTEVPYYQRVFQERALRLRYLRLHPEKIVSIKAYYRTHIADFINEWGVTIDPRNASERSGAPAFMPFTLDPKQREWCDWTFQNWLDNEYGGTEKSRDVGLSWLLVAFSVSLCVLYDDFVGGIGSFKQDKVDLRGDMGSLFEKARAYIRREYLLPRKTIDLPQDALATDRGDRRSHWARKPDGSVLRG